MADRQVALELLKPSPRDLQHGLELHAASLVFDGYGFSPRSAPDGDRLRAAYDAGSSEQFLHDLAEESPMVRLVEHEGEQAEYRQAWEAAGVTCIFQNAGEEGHDPLKMLKRLARFTYVTDLLRDFVSKAGTPDDIVAAHRAGRRALYFTTNGVPLMEDWDTVEDELAFVRVYHQLGVRMMHVTYNRRNMLGDGCAETANGGLSDFGRAAIAELNRLGIIVDVAHSGWQTSLESAKVSERPMVASHSACAAVKNHIRAKPTEVIKAIVDTGGYIGICCIPSFLGGDGDIVAFLDQIDYVAERFGPEAVSIGTDVAYTSRQLAHERKKVPAARRRQTRFGALWPEDAFVPSSPKHRSLAWTNWPMFTVGLVQRGYSDDDIQKILGLNVLRVCQANSPQTNPSTTSR